LALIRLNDALGQAAPSWKVVFGLFVVFPAAVGAVGAAVGLAIWLLGRIVRRLVP
jgi:hypothetical protein